MDDTAPKLDNEVLTTKFFMDAVAEAPSLTWRDCEVLSDLATRNTEQNMFIHKFVLWMCQAFVKNCR